MKIIVYKNGSYKSVEDNYSWEYENDPDYLVTIPSELYTPSLVSGSLEHEKAYRALNGLNELLVNAEVDLVATDGVDGPNVKAFRALHLKHITELRSFLAGAGYSKGGEEIDHEAEKEVMMQAFAKVYKMFQARSWIMEGRGSYRYDDDRYKEEVRYLYDEFEALHTDTWKNIKSKSVDFRNKVIEDYKKDNPSLDPGSC